MPSVLVLAPKLVHLSVLKLMGHWLLGSKFVCGKELGRRSADSCDAMLRVELKGQDRWIVTKFVKEHTHSTVELYNYCINLTETIEEFESSRSTAIIGSNLCKAEPPQPEPPPKKQRK
ncbi:hypothetical protein Tsubulata_022849 [Turnera subulata]|uniref:FAR1 domain-containing protein n=1 Tax=Turnera subulata TaxID=218843 RepID=A0A9Q0FE72_9ROSI|nr:hypothetical protein Tsubulata_022849 [Turnera subulata]